MKLPRILSAILLLSLSNPLLAQQTQPAPKSNAVQSQEHKANGQSDVVKIGVTLVQVDVTVTDSKGNRVSDLKPEDFEVLQNNKPQPITNFSYVSAPIESTKKDARNEYPKPAKNEPPAPPPRLQPDQVRRTIALVVDDLTLSFESTASVRDTLKKFIDQQMQPGDLVAIIRTGAGMGALQQFTNDKRQLYAALDLVRWKPGYGGGLNAFSPVQTDPAANTLSILGKDRPSADPDVKAFDITGTFGSGGSAIDDVDRFRQEVFAVGTLGAMSFVVQGLRQLPGRKSVVLFSDGLKMYDREQNITRVRNALDNLTDLANRASVSFYTIDARGLVVLSPSAADDLSGDLDPISKNINENTDYSKFLGKTASGVAGRQREFLESREGLAYLADRTGGLFYSNNNALDRGVRRALMDQEGYYLIGFVPEESTFKSKNGSREFQNIAVKVNRPGLKVHTRTGFYGITDEESRPVSSKAARDILTALASPFSAGAIPVRITTQFWLDPKEGTFVNALLHIDAHELTFEETVNGWRKTTFEIAAFTFGDNGKVIDRSDRAYTVNMSEKDYQRTLETGVFYRVNLPIKKPGAYQLRTAVRDQKSNKVGSANQFIQIPDLKKNRLVLSGLLVRRADPVAGANKPDPAGNAEGRVERPDVEASPAVRKFKPGTVIEYAYAIFGAKVEKTTDRAQLLTQVRLYRDGKLVFDGERKPFAGTQSDLKRLIAGGSLRLGGNLTPGEYALQVIAFDKLAKESEQIATVWIDFEIIR
jgi:VWFA-related protein